eukprot:scaffold21246_cov110-Isochrysis_galbana.AAC.6
MFGLSGSGAAVCADGGGLPYSRGLRDAGHAVRGGTGRYPVRVRGAVQDAGRGDLAEPASPTARSARAGAGCGLPGALQRESQPCAAHHRAGSRAGPGEPADRPPR